MSLSVNTALSAEFSSSAAQKNSSSDLSMDDFMQILSAELQYQDPMEPTDNSQYMSQMAQVSLLQQVESLAKQINFSAASSSIGQNVLYSVTDDSGNSTISSGTIDAVDISTGSPAYLVNGQWLTQDEIGGFYQPAPSGSDGDSSGSGSDGGVNT